MSVWRFVWELLKNQWGCFKSHVVRTNVIGWLESTFSLSFSRRTETDGPIWSLWKKTQDFINKKRSYLHGCLESNRLSDHLKVRRVLVSVRRTACSLLLYFCCLLSKTTLFSWNRCSFWCWNFCLGELWVVILFLV